MSTITPNDKITIALSVTDRAASSAWYQKHLGFTELFSVDEAGWTELATNTPGVTLGMGDAQKVSFGNTMPVFGVEDFDASRKALEAGGVKFDGDTIEVEGMVKVATFFDPDGNGLMIAEDLSQK
jgi:CreA protein